MTLTGREMWAVIHGMMLGSLFLLAYAGGLAELINLGSEWATEAGISKRVRRLMAGTWIMAIVAWLTVITGTYIVYPWYRAKPPDGADLTMYPRSFLLTQPTTAGWHNFGMEWKEHIAWLAPILATAVAYMVTRYGTRLAKDDQVRRAVIVLFSVAFFAAAVAGLFGAFINKAAPIH
jgi:peptidoglycan/LPS O-acetylase OafA/YrhL